MRTLDPPRAMCEGRAGGGWPGSTPCVRASPGPRSTDRYPRGGAAPTMRAWSASLLRPAPPRRGPAYWSAAPSPVPTRPAPSDIELTIDAFSRAWRRADRPAASAPALPDELRLRRARKRLAEFGTLWRNPAVPDRLREEALHEIFARVDVEGSQLAAVHPQPNENAWLLGLAALRQEQHVGMVGARGVKPPGPTLTSRPGPFGAASSANIGCSHVTAPCPDRRSVSIPEPMPGGPPPLQHDEPILLRRLPRRRSGEPRRRDVALLPNGPRYRARAHAGAHDRNSIARRATREPAVRRAARCRNAWSMTRPRVPSGGA